MPCDWKRLSERLQHAEQRSLVAGLRAAASDPLEAFAATTISVRYSAFPVVRFPSHQQPHCAGKLPSARKSP